MEASIHKKPAIRNFFPDLSEEQRAEIEEFLDAYCEIVLEICERRENASFDIFDGDSPAS
jgi:hypothetical protein